MSIYEQFAQVRNRVGHGRAYGTFGELLQGRLKDGERDFLVTFPIKAYSTATFYAHHAGEEIAVFPITKQKSLILANLIIKHYALPGAGTLLIESELPIGKGMASSSADLVATARAMSSCFGIQISLTQLLQFMRQIEPSDGVMFPGAVSFYHRHVQLCKYLGRLPPLTVVGLDEGGMLDTVQFNQRRKPFTLAEMEEYHVLLKRISQAIPQHDTLTIGQVATRSALLNQKLNPKRTLDSVIDICHEIHGLGVVVAHSGTCLGILLSPQSAGYDDTLRKAQQYLSSITATVLIYHALEFQCDGLNKIGTLC